MLALALAASGAEAREGVSAVPPSPPPLEALLPAAARAFADPGASESPRLTIRGTVAGSALSGAFTSWRQGDRERTDQTLGPRLERTLRLGDRVWFADENADVRALTGVLLRRERTQRFVESGDFTSRPDRCVERGPAFIEGRPAYAIDVSAEGGETETVYLDAATALPARLAYDDDDGRTTIDFSDWRTVAGRRFPYRSVVSDGDHAFDTVAVTTAVDPAGRIDPAVFAPFVPRRIDMPAPETIALQFREGHLYAPVRIAGRDFTFLIDSGAQDIVLDARLAADVGLSSVGALEASGATRTGGLGLARVPRLDIGSGHLGDLVVGTLALGASTDGAFRIDGILGYPFFAAATVRIDIAQRTMTFGPPGSLPPLGERLALETDRGVPEAQLRVNATTDAPFILDTGNAGELLLYKPFVDRHAGIVPYSATGRRSYGIGGGAESYRSSLSQISFGDIPLYNTDTDVMLATRGAFADRFDAGNVGLGLLRNFIVTFDESSDAVYLARAATFDDGRARN